MGCLRPGAWRQPPSGAPVGTSRKTSTAALLLRITPENTMNDILAPIITSSVTVVVAFVAAGLTASRERMKRRREELVQIALEFETLAAEWEGMLAQTFRELGGHYHDDGAVIVKFDAATYDLRARLLSVMRKIDLLGWGALAGIRNTYVQAVGQSQETYIAAHTSKYLGQAGQAAMQSDSALLPMRAARDSGFAAFKAAIGEHDSRGLIHRLKSGIKWLRTKYHEYAGCGPTGCDCRPGGDFRPESPSDRGSS